MTRLLVRLLGASVLLALVAGGAGSAWAWRQIHRPFQGYEAEKRVEVRPGQGASAILHELAAAGVLDDARLARLYLIYYLGDPPLKAGEYHFGEPLSAAEVLDRLIRGSIVTYPLTVIEGLTFEETADSIADQAFGDPEVLRREMRRTELIADLDPEAANLEGYLYPDTYHFARGATEAEIVAKMVQTFRQRFRESAEPFLAGRTVRQVVTLASIVEKEALLDEERPLIAGVYAHRLRRGIALYADPTVIYAIKMLGRWDGNLRKEDLRMDSPYNTYVYPGLPPGPICSPAVKSLAAAASPADTRYLYFVSRNDGSHVFAETYRKHQQNVDRWQREYWRQRWAKERSK